MGTLSSFLSNVEKISDMIHSKTKTVSLTSQVPLKQQKHSIQKKEEKRNKQTEEKKGKTKNKELF
jgi:hypothetical protein